MDRMPLNVLKKNKIHVNWKGSRGARIKAFCKLVWFVVCIWLMGVGIPLSQI